MVGAADADDAGSRRWLANGVADAHDVWFSVQVGHGVGAADALATGFLMVPGAAAFAGWHFHPASAADSDDLDFGKQPMPPSR